MLAFLCVMALHAPLPRARPPAAPLVQPAAPSAADRELARFPGPDLCAGMTLFWGARQDLYGARAALDPALRDAHLREARRAELALDAWQDLQWAQLYPDGREFWLAELRDRLGPHDYFMGQMPFPEPEDFAAVE